MFNFMWPLLLPLVPFTLLDQSTARVITQGNSKEQAPLVTSSQDPGTLATRSYFYVGGEYVCNSLGQHIFEDQMYVEKLVPSGGRQQKYPVVLIHGKAQTGTNWLNTPDERQGWASWFLQNGYTVYIVDQPQRGRSAYDPYGALDTFTAEAISKLFTGVQHFKLWPQAYLHTQWPGPGIKGDPIFDAFYASNVPFLNDTVQVQNKAQKAGAALLDRIGPAVLITHSEGGLIGFAIADVRPSLVKALISIEPEGPPFEDFPRVPNSKIDRPFGLTSIPITYNPPVRDPATDLHTKIIPPAGKNLSECVTQASSPPKKLVNLAKVPQLVVTSEASFHAIYDYCTVQYLKQGGVDVDFLELSKDGIHGNAHFLFMEKNNLDIAAKIEAWISKKKLSC